MLKACSRCGKIHPYGEKCYKNIIYRGGEERELRAKSAWHKKSIEIRENANYLCEICKDHNEIAYKDLEVHHIIPLRIAPELLLDNNNLVCLCTKHHREADSGKYSVEYLQKLAMERER